MWWKEVIRNRDERAVIQNDTFPHYWNLLKYVFGPTWVYPWHAILRPSDPSLCVHLQFSRFQLPVFVRNASQGGARFTGSLEKLKLKNQIHPRAQRQALRVQGAWWRQRAQVICYMVQSSLHLTNWTVPNDKAQTSHYSLVCRSFRFRFSAR